MQLRRPRRRVVPPSSSKPAGIHPSLIDVFERHPEWRRRTELTLRAKMAGRPVPKFPLLATTRKQRAAAKRRMK
jgi:hypothetical protein